MPVRLPTAQEVSLTPPDPQEAALTARGVASAAAPATGLTDVQRLLLEALFPAMTGHRVDLSDVEPMSPRQFADVLRRRDLQFRTRGVQVIRGGHMPDRKPGMNLATPRRSHARIAAHNSDR